MPYWSDWVLANIWGYPIHLLEALVFLTGFIAVAITAKGSIWGLVIGLFNIVLAAYLYYGTQLYSDFILQFYYFATNIWGIVWWRRQGDFQQIAPQRLQVKEWFILVLIFCILSYNAQFVTARLHIWSPSIFILPAQMPLLDAMILAGSLCAQWLMVRRISENWLVWLGVNCLAVYVYGVRELYLLSLLFGIYGVISAYGWWKWYCFSRSKP